MICAPVRSKMWCCVCTYVGIVNSWWSLYAMYDKHMHNKNSFEASNAAFCEFDVVSWSLGVLTHFYAIFVVVVSLTVVYGQCEPAFTKCNIEYGRNDILKENLQKYLDLLRGYRPTDINELLDWAQRNNGNCVYIHTYHTVFKINRLVSHFTLVGRFVPYDPSVPRT